MTERLPDWFWRTDPFIRTDDRRIHLLRSLNNQTAHHAERCEPYARIVASVYGGIDGATRIEDVPFVPVGLFKRMRLQSVTDENVYRVLRSSGTTQAETSRVFLDRETSQLQGRALARIMSSLLGAARRPMIVIDAPAANRGAEMTARLAAVAGLIPFGRDHFFALEQSLAIDHTGLDTWLESRSHVEPFIFGFTFLVWQWVQQLRSGVRFDGGVLLHGGGWKKMQDRSVSPTEFRDVIREKTGIERVHDYYGFVEQVGGIHVECELGFLHSPIFSDVIVRDPRDWQPAPDGVGGVLQTVSVLPWSYPGHSILTEDLGIVYGRDDCQCGRGGTRFRVLGRVPKTVLRGCSDTLVA